MEISVWFSLKLASCVDLGRAENQQAAPPSYSRRLKQSNPVKRGMVEHRNDHIIIEVTSSFCTEQSG